MLEKEVHQGDRAEEEQGAESPAVFITSTQDCVGRKDDIAELPRNSKHNIAAMIQSRSDNDLVDNGGQRSLT